MTRIRVAALAVRGADILLARHVKDGRTSYLLPGGGLEDDENAHEALARELREEASVEAAISDLRYVIEIRAPDGSRHIVQLVFATTIVGEIGDSTDPRVARCEWRPLKELRSLPLHPDVGDILADDLSQIEPVACRYVLAKWSE